VTWGKVDKDTYQQATESMQADYSTLMPFIVKALLDRRKHYQQLAEKEGLEVLCAREPNARGYLRPSEGYRLYAQREQLVTRLVEDVRLNREWLEASLAYGLARS
jgi:deoxyhypusine synthase